LTLADTPISDTGLAHLRGMTSLGLLELRGTRITDVCVVLLATLTGLTELDVSETRVTSDGVARLKAALPKCQIAAEGLK
jgi:hypothetical protein